MRAFLYAIPALLLLASEAAHAGDPPFEVIPPEEAEFNYPAPPREGAPDYFTIADDGQARCVIVHAAAASDRLRYRARLLGDYLGRVTGGTFKLLPDSAPIPEGMGAIHFGDTAVSTTVPLALPDVRYGDDVFPNVHGFLIQTISPRILILRGSPLLGLDSLDALAYALVGFLERYAGVRQFWMGVPGSIGESIFSRPTLRIPKLEWRDWPYFISRSMSMHPLLPGGSPLDFFRRGTTLPCSENYYELLPPREYGEDHPEYYPLIQGKRRVPPRGNDKSRWQPCVSNPEVVKTVTDAVMEYFRSHPRALGYNVAINDGHGDCTCSGCRAMDAPGTDYGRRIGMCDRYGKFSNKVAALVDDKYPSKSIVFLAYSATQHPPQTVDLHPNILPVMTVDSAFTAWDRWMATGVRRMGLYLHHNGKSHFILPKMDIQQTGRRIRYIVASGRARTFKQEMHLHWPVSGAIAYITSKLLWDPRRDVDELLDEYCQGLFGPAAAPMRRWHEAIEAGYERWLEEMGMPHGYAKDLNATSGAGTAKQFRVLNEAEAARAAADLKDAAASPGLDPVQTQRIALVEAMFRLQEMGVQRYWAAERLRQEPVRSQTDVRRAIDDARRVIALSTTMRDYIANTLEQPPLDRYRIFRDNRPHPVSYHSMKQGKPNPGAVAAINGGIRAAAEFLRDELGPEPAAKWWRAEGDKTGNPVLRAAFTTAESIALGLVPENLFDDPGYEALGARLAPDERDLDSDVELTYEQLLPTVDVRTWFHDRTPFRAALTRDEARSGNWSLMLQHFHRVRLGRGVPAKPSTRYRVGMWYRRNAEPGRYNLIIKCHHARQEGALPTTLLDLPVPDQPDEWHELTGDVVTPPDAHRLSIWFQIKAQGKEARCWVDDLFIGTYPK